MAIDKKLISFASKANFVTQLANSQILNSSIVFIQDTQEIWTHGIFFDCKIRYPSTFAWASGTTSGPTGTLSGTGISNISFGAIPSASATNSGIVTTGTQTFAGAKTFNSSVTCQAFSGTTGSFSDAMTVKSLTISNTDAIPHVVFSRTSYNYFTAPSGGSFAFLPNGVAFAITNAALIIKRTDVSPGITNSVSCGTTTYRWSSVNSVAGNFSGNVTISGTVTGTWKGNTIGVTYGGTGKNSVAINNMLYASSANTYSEVATSSFGRGLLNTTSGTTISGLISESSNWLNGNSLLTYGANGLNYFNLNGTGGTTPNANVTPVSGWHHVLRMNHGNTGGYFTDISTSINNIDGLYWRQVRNGVNYGWFKVLDSNNISTYSFLKKNEDSTITGKLWLGGAISVGSSAKLQVYGFMRTGPIMIATGFSSSSTFDIINEKWILNNNGNLSIGTSSSYGDVILHAGNFSSYALPLGGGTINGAVTINNYQYQKWNLYVGAKTSYNDANNGIVLNASGAMDITGAEPYIDLHYGNTTTEYTTRLIEYGNGVFSIANGTGLYLGSTFVSSLSYRLYVAGTQYNEGNITTNGELNLGATTAANAVLKLNNKIAIRGYDSWLRINDIGAFTNGIYCGSSVFRTDGEFQVGSSGQFFKVTTAGNVTAKNLTLNGSLTGVTTANFGNAVTALGTMSIGTTNLGYYGTNSGSITNTQFCVSPYLDKYQVAFGSSTSQSWTFVQNNTNNKPIAYAAINAQMLSNVAGAETGILRFFIKPSALGGTEAARLTDQSNFLIGYTTEQGARLAVNGLTNSTSLYCTSNLYIRTTSLTYRDTNTGTNSANVPFIISGYSGKYQAVDAGSSSQSWNFIQNNSASNRIRYATVNAQMVSSAAGTETGVLRFYTKPASGAIAEALRIDENQRTLVGYSSNPGTYKFAVNGTSYFNGAVTTPSGITCSSILTDTIGADSYSITGGSVLTCPNNTYVVPTVIWHGKVDCVTNPIITKFQGISELSVLKYATGKYDFSFNYTYHVPAAKDFYQVIITPRGRDTGEVNMIWGMCADDTKTRDSFQLKLSDDANGFNDGYLEIMIIEVSSSIITS